MNGDFSCKMLIYLIIIGQGGRSWQPFVRGTNGHKNFRQAQILPFSRQMRRFCAQLQICKFIMSLVGIMKQPRVYVKVVECMHIRLIYPHREGPTGLDKV